MQMNFAGYRVLPVQFVAQHSNGALDHLRRINLAIIRIPGEKAISHRLITHAVDTKHIIVNIMPASKPGQNPIRYRKAAVMRSRA